MFSPIDRMLRVEVKNSCPVSIVIPAYNEGHFIGGLLDSIRTYLDSVPQIIVVDNGSHDDTVSVAEKSGVQLIRLDKKTFPSIARNVGARYAEQEILIFLDADVEITSAWGRALQNLIETSDIQDRLIITGATYHVSKAPSWIENYWFQPLRSKKKSYINGGNIVTNRKTFNLLEGFDKNKETGEDVDFCERASLAGVEVITDERLIVHHEGFPKKMSGFLARERWHGKQDFSSLKSLISSKIALGTLGFAGLHSVLLVQLLLFAFGVGSVGFIVLTLSAVLALCVLRVRLDFGRVDIVHSAYSSFISYLYFLGRSLSLLDAIKKRLFQFRGNPSNED